MLIMRRFEIVYDWKKKFGDNCMEKKIFTKNDSGFICKNCGFEVQPLGYSSRNHCPNCLHSLHVDVNPGDRANECGGIMEPITAEVDSKKGYIIVHKCKKCGKRMHKANDEEMKNLSCPKCGTENTTSGLVMWD